MLASLQRRLRVFAVTATVLVLAMAATGRFVLLPEALVALALAGVVPLGAALAADADAAGRARGTARLAAACVPLGAASGIAALSLPRGPLAGALAAVWLAAALVLAAGGAARILRRGALPLEELAIDAGHLYLPVGAAWLWASRAGVPLLGFREPVVLYTAAHFHFAGFGACVVAGLLGRELGLRRAPSDRETVVAGPVTARAYAVAAVVVLLGIPLVAAGITVGHALELPAAIFLSGGMLTLMVLLFLAGGRRLARRDASGLLLLVAGAALSLSMVLAATFAATGSATRGAEAPLIPYTWMAAIHGTANAVGFALAAMAAFTLRPPPRRHDALGGTWPRLFGRGFVGPDFFAREGAVDPSREVAGQVGTLDDFAHDGFTPAGVDPLVRDFYERTAHYRLTVTPTWHAPFRTAGRAYAWLAARVLGNVVLPTRPEGEERVTTRLFAVEDARDGRADVRGYVRAYGAGPGARANFVAAYATHRAAGLRLLSAAFPLPFSALVGVLRFEDGAEPGGLALASHARPGEGPGDEGLFLVTPLGPIRLPVDERIEVWVTAGGALRARHATRVLGLPCFTLAYAIERAGEV